MDLQTLFNSSVMPLPKDRKTGQSLSDQLEEQTAGYLPAIKKLDTTTVIGAAVKKRLPAIKATGLVREKIPFGDEQYPSC